MLDNYSDITSGVKNLLGDPKKAIWKIAFPMIIGMFLLSIYQIVDGFWVAGLGPDALAAVGLFYPFFLMMIALGSGLGMGGSSLISRKIAEREKKEADNTAIHTIIISLIIGFIVSLISFPFIDYIFSLFNINIAISDMAASYAKILFLGTPIILISNVLGAILRGEGDAKRAMFGLAIGSLLNIILDPLFIYTFNFGVSGAAIATLISLIISILFFIYCFFIKNDTYLKLLFSDFKFNVKLVVEILKLGIPSTISQIAISFSLILLNVIVMFVGGTDGVAVFTSGWRIVMMAVIPQIGLIPAVSVVTGAAFGNKNINKLKIAFFYTIKLGVLIEICAAILIFIFSSQIVTIFTYTDDASRITLELINFIRITVLFYPILPIGTATAAMFIGIGKGLNSLIVNFLRTVVFQVSMSFIFGVFFGYGLTGIWFGIVIGTYISACISFIWSQITFKNLSFS